MAEQTGYGEPHNFIRNPLGWLSTKGSTTRLRGTIRLYGIPLEGPCWTIQEHGRPKGNMGIRPYRIIWVPYGTVEKLGEEVFRALAARSGEVDNSATTVGSAYARLTGGKGCQIPII